MKSKIYKTLIVILYSISIFIFLFCLKVRLNSRIYIYTNVRLFLLFLSCLFIYIAGYILVKKFNCSKKILKINLIIYFIIYTTIIITLTLFDEIFGRHGLVVVDWNKELLETYMKYSFNLVPFKTINLFINGYINEYVNFKNFAINIFGNLFVLMPYGMFIPLIFRRINKYYEFFIIMTILVIGIEVLQFITLSGSCDIDDLILNVLGASVVYFICRIKIIRRLISKIFLFE